MGHYGTWPSDTEWATKGSIMTGERRISRRTVLRGAATSAALAGAGVAVGPLRAQASRSDDGLVPTRMAMHVHAAFSEGIGSMQAHLAEAERTGVQVVWWTEHDHRMVARGFLSDVHFDALTESSNGASVTWRPSNQGSFSRSSASIVTKPVSPNDIGSRAMRLAAVSAGAPAATRAMTASVKNYGLNTSIDGTTVNVDVRPVDVGGDAWFDIVVVTSYRPATGGRPAGQYRLRYRIGGGDAVGTAVEDAPLDGLMVLGARTSRWNTLTLDLVADFSRLWPDIDFRDAALTEFSFAVTSRNQMPATTVVDALRFVRERKDPDSVLLVQSELMAHYTPLFPSVVQHQGLEVSQSTPHLNWLGNPKIWPSWHPGNSDLALAVSTIHDGGGVVSYNHPFGTSGGPFSKSMRKSKRRSLTATLVAEKVFGSDILEVGYSGGRAGMTQNDYVGMWDVLSRNLVFATGVGVTDDHRGVNWTGQQWRHVTGVWSSGTEVESLQAALRAGRAWFSDLAVFNGTIDVLAAGFVPMGSVGMVDTDRCSFDVYVTDLPPNWRVAVVSGVADEAGGAVLDPEVSTCTFTPEDVVDGVLSVTVDSAVSGFHRVVLLDSSGSVRAYSNPVWLLRAAPLATVPDCRWVAAPSPPTDPPV